MEPEYTRQPATFSYPMSDEFSPGLPVPPPQIHVYVPTKKNLPNRKYKFMQRRKLSLWGLPWTFFPVYYCQVWICTFTFRDSSASTVKKSVPLSTLLKNKFIYCAT